MPDPGHVLTYPAGARPVARATADGLVGLLAAELDRRSEWLLHEQDAVGVIARALGCDAATARRTLDHLVATRQVTRHRPRRRNANPNGTWPPRHAQDAYSVASSPAQKPPPRPEGCAPQTRTSVGAAWQSQLTVT